ncbi:MAG: SPOR domain-containing protein [Myxococcales bacterium]|nr:SPOR domain-containing protein [Myxococcales bacterium]
MGIWIVAAFATIGLVLAMGTVLGQAGAAEDAKDPYAALDRLAGLEAAAATGSAGLGAAPKAEDLAKARLAERVDPTTLSFPETLAEDDEGALRPEVEAAIASAAAELAHPDPVHDNAHSAAAIEAPPTDDSMAHDAVVEQARPEPEVLPAAIAASKNAQAILPKSGRDPLVAASTPTRTQARAPSGYAGKYMLQVISYQSAAEAQAFSEELRARGHKSFVMRADIADRGTFHRVRIGPFEKMHEAEEYREAFESSERMNTFVVRQAD